MIIQDPSTGHGASVDELFRLQVFSEGQSLLRRAALVGDGVVFSTGHTTSGADEEVLSFRNDDDADFVVDSIVVGSAVAGVITLATASGTPGGASEISAVPLRLGETNVKDYTAHGGASVTGLTLVLTLASIYVAASETVILPFGGALIVPKNVQIAVSAGQTGAVVASIYGYWA